MSFMVTNGRELWGKPDTTVDYCVNGKCSGCGQCCSNYLPLSDKEIKAIKLYIKRNNIQPAKHLLAPVRAKPVDMICPFRDEEKRVCTIYEVRPLICRIFQCNRTPLDVCGEALKHPHKKRTGVNVRATFFGDFDEQIEYSTRIMEMRANRGGAKLVEQLKREVLR